MFSSIEDMKVLVSFYLNDQHTVLLGTNLLHPKFSWTLELMEGLCNYATYWCRHLKTLAAHGEEGPFTNYRNCLEVLIEALQGGHRRKCLEYKEASYADKGREDLYVLRNFPSIEKIVQPAVWKAYCIMRHLGQKYATGVQVAMASKDRALANTMVVGAWQCDTFMGRKWEIEHALRVDVAAALKQKIGYILAKQHKTHPTYGDIVKLITAPGLENALLQYDAFPRLGTHLIHAMRSCMCMHGCICMHACKCMYAYVSMHEYISMHACLCMHMYACMRCLHVMYVMHEA